MNLCCKILFAIAFAFVLGNVISSSTENVANAEELAQRRELLRNLTKEAWQAYVQEVMTPKVDSKHFWIFENMNNTIILNIMPTLWTMGLKEEFAQGQEWIGTNFVNFSQSEDCPAHPWLFMNEVVGGLLSCYALTNDIMFRDKAFEIASVLQQGYDNFISINQTGIGNSILGAKTGDRKFLEFKSLSEIGSSELEAHYLNSLAPEKFVNRTSLWRAFLRNHTDSRNRALFSEFDFNNWEISGNKFSEGFSGNVFQNTQSLTIYLNQLFYANLVKRYAQSNGTDLDAIELFMKAIETAVQLGMITTVNGLSYIRDYKLDTKQFDNYMRNRGCNYGAVLRIGADALEAIREHNQTVGSKTNKQLNQIITQHRNFANQITEACHFAASQTATKVLPTRSYINEQDRETNKDSNLSNQHFESGLEESYFVQWRSTKEPKYREYAWELTKAYDRVLSANKLNFVLRSAAILYLYLIFSEDTVLPSNQWLFTSLGRPLPILSPK